jgi:predicted porin
MKKSLFALAALTAIAGAAQAQSSVTLYGALDAGLYYGNKVGADNGINGSTAATQGKDINVAYADSTIVSSIWGLKGAEDLGGGLKGTFNVEGDIQTNNGGTNSAGLFRRQANVGLDSAKYGALALGLKTNPLIATGGVLMPVAGNSVSTNLAMAGGFADFFTRNAVTYTSPVWAGFQTQAQVGLGNTVGDNGGGNVYAISAAYTGIQNLAVRAAYQNRVHDGSASSSNYANAASSAFSSYGTQTQATAGKTTYLAGASYKLGSFTLAYAYTHNEVDASAARWANGSRVHAQNVFGVGYQATPKLLLGATYAAGTLDYSLINAQARYSLSPRTSAYAQLGVATNGAYAAIAPIATQTSASPAANVANYGRSANTTQSAFGLGVIHTF